MRELMWIRLLQDSSPEGEIRYIGWGLYKVTTPAGVRVIPGRRLAMSYGFRQLEKITDAKEK